MPVTASLPPSPAFTRRSSRYSHALNPPRAAPPPATPPTIPGSAAIAPPASGLGQVNVVVVERLAVDAVPRRGDPRGDLASLVDRLHQRADVGLVHVGGQPLALALPPVVRAQLFPVRSGLDPGECAHLPVQCHVRQPQPLRQPG